MTFAAVVLLAGTIIISLYLSRKMDLLEHRLDVLERELDRTKPEESDGK